jgi:hypothetical protein
LPKEREVKMMNYLEGFRDACRLCVAKIKASVTREAAVKEVRTLLRLARKGEEEKLKEMVKNG